MNTADTLRVCIKKHLGWIGRLAKFAISIPSPTSRNRSIRRSRRCMIFMGMASLQHLAVAGPCQLLAQEKPKPEVPVLNEATAESTAAIGGFKKPNGWNCELFAAEPLMGNPVAFAIDALGRIFVCESYRQNKGVTDNRGHDRKWLAADLSAMTVEDRIRYHRNLLKEKAIEYETHDDLIRLLVDTDGDHKADQSKVFASGFNGIEEGTGAGALVRGDRVYYTNIPKLWALIDKDNDGQSDDRIVLSDGYGVRVAFRGHDMHGLIIGHDGRLYFSIGDRGYHVNSPSGLFADPESGAVFRCELDGSNLEVIATGLRNPQELAFDDYGNLFTGDNNSDSGDKARWVYVVRGGDTGWRMMYQYISDRGPFNQEKIWHPYHKDTPAYIIPPIANVGDGPSGLVCYPGTGILSKEDPNRFQNAFFMCDFRGQSSNSGIRMIKVRPKGAFFELAENEQFIWNILATDVDFGPDGGMYVSDWVNGWNGENKGRIYRFSDSAFQESEQAKSTLNILKTGMKNRTFEELRQLLGHPDRRIRLESQWELALRGDRKVFTETVQQSDAPFLKRLHAVYGLGQIMRASPNDRTVAASLERCLSDREPFLAARAAEMLSDAGISAAATKIASLLTHESAVVKAAACMALGKLRYADALPAVAKILIDNNDQDPILRHAGIMAILGVHDAEKLKFLIQHPNESVRLATVVALRKQQNLQIVEFLKDSSATVLREAVRAIHDVPGLHAHINRIAELTISPETDDATVRRVLNANFRIGTSLAANRLASFAASSACKDSLRIEALEMLRDWSEPGDRDRIMNRHLPLVSRDLSPAIQVLKDRIELLSSAPTKVRDRFMDVAAKMGIQEVVALIVSTAKDAKASGVRRAAAIKALGLLDADKIQPFLAEYAINEDLDVRLAAIEVISKVKPNDAVSLLQRSIQSKISRERQFAWDTLGQIKMDSAKKLIEEGVQRFLNKSLPTDCWLNVIEIAEGNVSAELALQLKQRMEMLESVRETDPKKYYADCVDGGDASNGKMLFFTRSNLSCVRCHKVGETGGEVGPALSSLGKQKDREYLLEAIVAPNAVIAQGFETAIILDDSGTTHTGIVRSEDDQTVVLMDAQGVTTKIDKATIDARKKGASSMPADLMKYLSKRELRDLVAYLASLDGSPAATTGFTNTDGHRLE